LNEPLTILQHPRLIGEIDTATGASESFENARALAVNAMCIELEVFSPQGRQRFSRFRAVCESEARIERRFKEQVRDRRQLWRGQLLSRVGFARHPSS